MKNYYIIINEATEGSWSTWVWSDVNQLVTIFYDSTRINNNFIRRLEKIHFSNKLNRIVWLPFKQIWNRFFCIQTQELNSKCINYIIFQSNIKFAPKYLCYLKEKKNVKIILYLPDTVQKLGIATSYKEFLRYCQYYQVDAVYSFDKADCKKYNLTFFDIYSMNAKTTNVQQKQVKKLLYVGNLRSKRRLELLYNIYDQLHDVFECTFYINGVSEKNIIKDYNIYYNCPLNYSEVIELVKNTDAILELINDNQEGNTLRYKEAVCYNKFLITNNKHIPTDKYSANDGIFVFDQISDIISYLKSCNKMPDYNYGGEFSPTRLLDMIEIDLR